MRAKFVKIRSERSARVNMFVIHLHGRLQDSRDPTYVGPVYQAYMLLTQEDGSNGPAVMSLFGDQGFLPQVRKAWRAFSKDEKVTQPVEWSLKWLAKEFVRHVGRVAASAASHPRAGAKARGRAQGRRPCRTPDCPDRRRRDCDQLEIPPGGGIRFRPLAKAPTRR